MILKRKNNKVRFWLLIACLLLFAVAAGRRQLAESALDLRAEIMSLDPGFSTGRNLLGQSERNLYGISQKIYQIISGYLFGFPERPNLERLDIDIGFVEYEKLMQDRERFIADDILTNPTEVKAKMRFNDQHYKVKLRLKGDLGEHWRARKRFSFRVKIKSDGWILGCKKFSLHKPISRGHPFEQIFQSIIRRAGNLSSLHNYVRVFVNGDSWGVMNIEEHMSPELLEKQKKTDSLIIKFGNEAIWKFRNNPLPQDYRLSDSLLNIHLYGDKQSLKKKIHRQQLTYIFQERLKPHHAYLYSLDHYSRALMLASAWNFFHTLVHSNWRHYLNPYTLKLEPITTDQGEFYPITIDNQGYWTPELNSPFKMNLIQQLLNAESFKDNFSQNLATVSNALSHLQDDLNYYHSFFPIDSISSTDERFDTRIVTSNLDIIDKYQEFYFLQHKKKIPLPAVTEKKQTISNEEASRFPEHIYARHYDDGKIELYNLLREPIKLRKILLNGKDYLNGPVSIPGYTENAPYKPYVIRTNIVGIHDNALIFNTEFKGNIRSTHSGITLLTEDVYNPLLTVNDQNELLFLHEVKKGIWEISSGDWNIDHPVTIQGTLKIAPNTHLRFAENAYLIVKGEIQADGENGPIVLEPQEKAWKGIYILGVNKTTSRLDNVVIRHTNQLSDGILRLFSGVTFYSSDVRLKNVTFDGSNADHALSIINSTFNLEDIQVRSTAANGFGCNFSTGTINDSSFNNIGDDAVTYSGCKVNVARSNFLDVHDKATIAGQASQIHMSECTLRSINAGIAVKDGSVCEVDHSNITNYKVYAGATYIRKNFYGDPVLTIRQTIIDKSREMSFLRQYGTSLIVDEKEIVAEEFNMQDSQQRE